MHKICSLFKKEHNNFHFSLSVFSVSKAVDYIGASFGRVWEHGSKWKSGR